jgi:hypothetical protein
MLLNGLSKELATNYLEPGRGFQRSLMMQYYPQHQPPPGKVKPIDLTTVFIAAYQAS